jgi:cytochrome P450
VWAFARYEQVRSALGDHETFVSGRGVGLSEEGNRTRVGTVIASDPPLHDQLRAVLAERLSPKALRALRGEIQEKADALVGQLVACGSFDAVADLAQAFPLSVVADLIGLPDDGREHLLEWANCGFNLMGPPNERNLNSVATFSTMMPYIQTLDAPGRLKPGSMGAAIYEAAERGEIRREQCAQLMISYLVAAMDTTINAISNSVMLFAMYPDQWQIVRNEPKIIPLAFEEIVRIESPVYTFKRVTSREVDVEGISIPENADVLMLYGSANRDERKWQDPERFDVRRGPVDHVGFGYGIHGCAGQGLARMEGQAILSALAKRVVRFEIGEPKRRLNNVIRGLGALPTTLHTN